LESEAETTCHSPPLRGRCPAGQRGVATNDQPDA
jgi:hypothetical protein